MDLMVHDIDILLSLVDSEIESMAAAAREAGHANVQFQFDNDAIASLTASRRTQQKVRRLSVTAESCRVNVDFISQTVEIHRHSTPEYIESNGDIRFRHESVVERPIVDNGEPLKAELAAFVTAAREGSEPVVTAEDGLRVLEVANEIEGQTEPTERMVPQQ
jgi:predicted dehydrogenase